MLRVPTFRSPLDMSMRWCTTGWVDARPDTIDTKLSASLRVVLSPMKRNSYFEAKSKSFSSGIRVWGGGERERSRDNKSKVSNLAFRVLMLGLLGL